MDRKVLTVVSAIVFLAIIASGYFFFQNQRRATTDSVNITPTQTISPSPTSSGPEIPEGWQTFNETNDNFTISHPSDIQTQTNQDGSVSFIKIGPTQTLGTELFDGLSVTIIPGSYNTGSFREFVETKRKEAADEPVTQEVSPTLQQTAFNGNNGYSFKVVGLGEFTHIFIPKNENTYLQISILVADPGDLGFQETVETMLSTLTI